MLSFQIKEQISRILTSFHKAKYFFDCLETIDSAFPVLDEYIQVIAAGGDKVSQSVTQLRKYLVKARQRIGDVKPRSFFASMEICRQRLNRQKNMVLMIYRNWMK